jgi:hypothetical protein
MAAAPRSETAFSRRKYVSAGTGGVKCWIADESAFELVFEHLLDQLA